MVRVTVLSGSHWHNGERYGPGDTLDVSESDYRAFRFKLKRLPDEAGREPLDKNIDTFEEVWAEVDATEAAVRDAVAAGLAPSDVEGTGTDGRVLVGDVRRAIG